MNELTELRRKVLVGKVLKRSIVRDYGLSWRTLDEFVSIDPELQSTQQAYEYASGNPINMLDPSGAATMGYCVNIDLASPPSLRAGQGAPRCRARRRADGTWAPLAEHAAREAAEGDKLRAARKPKAPEDKAGAQGEEGQHHRPRVSRVMSTSNGYLQGYNCQAVANEEQVIVAAEVTAEQNDSHQLHPMIDAITAAPAEAGTAEPPEKLLADAGYASEEDFAALDAEDPDA